MTEAAPSRGRLAAAAGIIALVAAAGGYGIARWTADSSNTPAVARSAAGSHKTLYWYDPMVPSQHFDKPGKSPFMDMQLVPKFADEGGEAPGIGINPTASQTLGM